MIISIFNPPENATTFLQRLQYINSLTDVGAGGIIGIVILFVVAFVLFLITKAFPFEKSFPVAMLITTFIGILLGIMGLVPDNVIYLCIIILVISLWMLFSGSDSNPF